MIDIASILEAAGVHVVRFNDIGPASAATDPDHGSTNPLEGNPMNEDNDTTEPAPPAIVMHGLDPENLQAVSMNGLRALHDVFGLTTEILNGMISAPRFNVSETNNLNEAGKNLDALIDHLYKCSTLIAKTARARPEPHHRDVEDRAWLCLTRAAEFGDDLSDFAAMASAFAAEHSHAEYHDRHKGRFA